MTANNDNNNDYPSQKNQEGHKTRKGKAYAKAS